MADAFNFENDRSYSNAVIAVSSTDSAVVDLNGTTLLGVITPASLTATTFKIKACETADGTFLTVNDAVAGADLEFTVASSGHYSFAASLPHLRGLRFIKLSGNTAQLTAEKTIRVISARI